MGQVRRASWAIGVATALVISGGAAARADIASDKPAAILIYPKVATDSGAGVDTVIRMSNVNQTNPIQLHCFYLDANSHCVGGEAHNTICTNNPSVCTGGMCMPGWQEVDFLVNLTAGQPIEWKASDGLLGPKVCSYGSDSCGGLDYAECYKKFGPAKTCRTSADCDSEHRGSGVCTAGIPLTNGVCQRDPRRVCGSDADCNPFPGGACSQSNSGTRVPPVPEDPFVGELKCIAINPDGTPAARNELKGEALIEQSTKENLDVASYNALGIQATGVSSGEANVLTLGGPEDAAEYNGCPNYLILNHFFDDAENPTPGTDAEVYTNLVLVPCTEDLLRQVPGSAVVQYLVFNEFEQRFSTSRSVKCFEDVKLCNIDTRDCERSIFNVNVSGTLTGQTRMNPIGDGLLGIAIERHGDDRSAAFNLHMQGARAEADAITIP